MPSFTATTTKQAVIRRISDIRRAMASRVASREHAGPHRSFRLTPRSSYRGGEAEKLPTIPKTIPLIRKTFRLLKAERKPFLYLTLMYVTLSWLLIGLPDANQYNSIRDLLDSVFGAEVKSLKGAATLLISAAGGMLSPTKSELAQFITYLLATIFSLCFIWTARQHLAGNQTSARQALYNAAAPLVVIAVLIVVAVVQLLPASLGALLLSFTMGFEGGAVTGLEGVLMTLAAILLIVLSLYLIVPTFLAFIVATLPNTYPMAALRSARLLAYRRRGTVFLRLFGVSLLALLIWLLILVPIILIELWVNVPGWLPLLQLGLDAAAAVTLPVMTVFIYQLYRELL